jgi:hypothetical protein
VAQGVSTIGRKVQTSGDQRAALAATRDLSQLTSAINSINHHQLSALNTFERPFLRTVRYWQLSTVHFDGYASENIALTPNYSL